MIDARRLRILRAVADHRTVTAAAAALYLTPSAVSQQLAALEQETGHRLVERGARGARLTAAGEILLTHANAVLAQLERAEAELADYGAGVAGTVTVAAFATGIGLVLAPAIAELTRTAPGIRVRVQDAEGDASVPMVLDRQVDVAVAVEYRGAPGDDDHAADPGAALLRALRRGAAGRPPAGGTGPRGRRRSRQGHLDRSLPGQPVPRRGGPGLRVQPASNPCWSTRRTTSTPWSPWPGRAPGWPWCPARRCAAPASAMSSYGRWRASPRPGGSSPPYGRAPRGIR